MVRRNGTGRSGRSWWLKVFAGSLIVLVTSQVVRANDSQWLTDLSKAQEQAKRSRKLVLMDFNGSDWCPACQILRKEVFATPEFREYAKANLVLVDVDFPNKKELPKKQVRANEALVKKFEVEGLPTIIVLDSNGKKLEQKSGYDGQSAKEFIAELDKLRTKS